MALTWVIRQRPDYMPRDAYVLNSGTHLCLECQTGTGDPVKFVLMSFLLTKGSCGSCFCQRLQTEFDSHLCPLS